MRLRKQDHVHRVLHLRLISDHVHNSVSYVRFVIGKAATNGKRAMIQRVICIAEVEFGDAALQINFVVFNFHVGIDPNKNFYLERPTFLYNISLKLS